MSLDYRKRKLPIWPNHESRITPSCRRQPRQLQFEHYRPAFAGHPIAITRRVVGDPVEHIIRGVPVVGLVEAVDQRAEFDPAEHRAISGIDDRNAILLPDVREDQTVRILELDRKSTRMKSIVHRDGSGDAEVTRIAK